MSGESKVVRAQTVQDCLTVRPLVEAHIEYERSAAVLSPEWHVAFAQLLAAERIALFIARLGTAPVGYATVTLDVATWAAAPFAHLDCLFIDAAHRGAGIGRRLVDAAVEYARGSGVSELQWQTPSWNADTIRFYERLGASNCAKSRFTLQLAPAPAEPNSPLVVD